MNTLPEVGLSNAPIIFSSVDFPLPDGPTTDTNSPLFTEKLTFLRDITLPIEETYTLERFSTCSVTSESSAGCDLLLLRSSSPSLNLFHPPRDSHSLYNTIVRLF